MNTGKVIRILIGIYIVASTLAVLLFLPCNNLAIGLFVTGACSPYITFMLFCAAEIPQTAGLFALLWFVLFPIVMIVAYVFTFKKHYLFFWVMTILDIIVMALYAPYVFNVGSDTGIGIVLADLIFSLAYTLTLGIILAHSTRTRKTGNNPPA